MSELRKDPLTGDWVVFAPARGSRPYEFEAKTFAYNQKGMCPFCMGNEFMTPEETGRIGSTDQWIVRSVPNKFPALSDKTAQEDKNEFYSHCFGRGIHEVIIDSPFHEDTFDMFSEKQIKAVLLLLQERLKSALKRTDLPYIQVFKNMGPEAGASLKHSHWQMIGVPVLPPRQRQIAENCQNYKIKTGHNLFDDIIKQEEVEKKRIIAMTNQFVAFVPYAARHCYEVMIVSRIRESLTEFTNDERQQLGDILQKILQKAEDFRKGLCFNICFEEKPVQFREKGLFRWSAEVIPRMGTLAGFEYGTGMYINPVLPEEGAKIYH